MRIHLEAQETPFEWKQGNFSRVLEALSHEGYEGLISQAKQKFIEVFGSQPPEPPPSLEGPQEVDDKFFRRFIARSQLGDGTNLEGDLFFAPNKDALFYLAITVMNIERFMRGFQKESIRSHLRAGFIGDSSARPDFEGFIQAVSHCLKEIYTEPNWTTITSSNPQFEELEKNQQTKFVLANTITPEEACLAEILADNRTRGLALLIRRSGGILASDLNKKTGMKPEEISGIADKLAQSRLTAREYVVICNRTSNQVNRVDDQEKIKKMTELGILCSCGNPIAQERIEELFSSTSNMQKMLDQSFWMTVELVTLLRQAGIPDDRILLNLQEGAEEIDAFVDIDGNLIMFELKDNEFSMGHAYPFGGRIGLFKPETAMIVSTKGIAPDVKEYFRRVEPEAEIVYVEKLEQLPSHLRKVIDEIRAEKARKLISQFQPSSRIDVSLADMLGPKLGIAAPSRRRKGKAV